MSRLCNFPTNVILEKLWQNHYGIPLGKFCARVSNKTLLGCRLGACGTLGRNIGPGHRPGKNRPTTVFWAANAFWPTPRRWARARCQRRAVCLTRFPARLRPMWTGRTTLASRTLCSTSKGSWDWWKQKDNEVNDFVQRILYKFIKLNYTFCTDYYY